MKFTKLLPIALAFAMTTGVASAALTTKGNVDYQITVPEYYDIVATKTYDQATASVTGKYTGLTLGNALDATFTVITNMPSDVVYLYGETKAGSDIISALYGSETAPYLLFTKDTSTVCNIARASATDAAAGTTTSEDAIGFALSVDSVTPTGQLASATPSWDEGPTRDGIKYTLKNGKYVFKYSIATDALSTATFDTDDSQGTYKATLYMQRGQL